MTRVSRNEEVNHQSRADSSRRLAERELELRETFDMSPNDPLYVPQEWIEPGWEYHWVRISILGEPDYLRDVQTKKMGYTPVPADRHPTLCNDGKIGHIQHNYITYRGSMLCEIPKSIAEKRRQMQTMQNIQRADSLQGVNAMMSEPGTIKKDFGSYVTRTVSFSE